MDKSEKKLRNRIAELRKDKGLTIQQVADGIGVSNGTISRYEKGSREPKLETWMKLADFFDVPVSYIQGISNVKDKKQFESFKKFETYFRDNNDVTPIKKDGHLIAPPNMMHAYTAYFTEKNTRQLISAFNTFILNSSVADKKTSSKYKKVFGAISDENNDFVNDALSDMENIFKLSLIASTNNKQAQKVIDQIGEILSKNIKIIYEFEGLYDDN